MTILMNLRKRQFIVGIGGIFGAGFVHSLLPPGNIWIRAALPAATAIVIVGLSSSLLRHLPDPAHRMPTRWILAGTVAVVYLPYGWLVFMDYAWDSYRWHWIRIWPVLPGHVLCFLIERCLPPAWLPPRTEVTHNVFASVATALLLAEVVFRLLRLSRWFWPTIASLFVVSCGFGLMAYVLFRSG